jgi:O-antigen ligase
MLNKINIYLFSLFPISIVTGNLLLNSNIIAINLILLIYCWKNNNWTWLKNSFFKILIVFYAYIVCNSIYSYFINQNHNFEGIIRSLGFIKFILLGFSLNILITKKKDLDVIMLSWLIIITIIIIDVFFEFFLGHNIFNFKSLDQTRIVSFFYDENVVGGFILTFGFTICTFFFNKKLKFKKKILLNLLLFIIPICILITGERSNFLKSIILFSIIIFIINSSYLLASKKVIILFLIATIGTAIFSNQSLYIKQTEFFKRVFEINKNDDDYVEEKNFMGKFQNIKYFAHYDVSLKIFKDYPIFGVSNKNFRNKCHDEKYFDEAIRLSRVRCNTHPHQIHFELLSEQGLIGYLLFFYFILSFIKKNLLDNFIDKNLYRFVINFYLLIFLIPILPSGSLFATFNGTLFWVIFALANVKQNIFKNNIT